MQSEAFVIIVRASKMLVVADDGTTPLFGSPADAIACIKKRFPRAMRNRLGVAGLHAEHLSNLIRTNEVAPCDYRGHVDEPGGRRLEFGQVENDAERVKSERAA